MRAACSALGASLDGLLPQVGRRKVGSPWSPGRGLTGWAGDYDLSNPPATFLGLVEGGCWRPHGGGATALGASLVIQGGPGELIEVVGLSSQQPEPEP